MTPIDETHITARWPDRAGVHRRSARGAEDRRRARRAIGDADSVLNVGAGTGSYEPRDRPVVSVEPSAVMIAVTG